MVTNKATDAAENKKGKRKTSVRAKGPKASEGGQKRKGAAAREGSKTAVVIELLRRKDGCTSAEMLEATGWQPHSLRGFLSGTVKKKMGLTVESVKTDGERRYRILS